MSDEEATPTLYTLVEPSVRKRFEREMKAAGRATVDPDGLAVMLRLEKYLSILIDEQIDHLWGEYSSRDLSIEGVITHAGIQKRAKRARAEKKQ